MTRTPENLVYHELIGLPVEVSRSTDSGRTGLRGLVVDETRNTLIIETGKGYKTVIKDQCVFLFSLNSRKVKIKGSVIVGRPEDRIKKKFRRW